MPQPISSDKAPVTTTTAASRKSNPKAKKASLVAKQVLSKARTAQAERELEKSRVRRETLCAFCKALYEKNSALLVRDVPKFHEALKKIVESDASDEVKEGQYEELLETHEDVPKIRSLSFAEARLSALPEDIGHFTGLAVISLRNNRIRSLAPLDGLKNLFSINVYENPGIRFSEDQAPHIVRDAWS